MNLPSSPFYHWSFSLRFIAVVTVLTLVNCMLFPWKATLEWMIEGGMVENATILMYYFALTVLWLFPPLVLNRLAIASVSLLLLAAAARELDLHKALFGMSMLKMNFYRGFASGLQILEALLILSPVVAAIGYLVVRYGRHLLQAARARHPGAVTVITMVIFLCLLKIFDRAVGIIGEALGKPGEVWGYTTPAGLITMALEETLEMILPLLVVIAILQSRPFEQQTVPAVTR